VRSIQSIVFRLLQFCGLLVCFQFATAQGQELRVRISLDSSAPQTISISCESSQGINNWSFRNTYAGIVGLGSRIQSLNVLNGRDTSPARELAPGEFRSAERVKRFTYLVKLTEPEDSSALAHISWLSGDKGVLMFADLIPLTDDQRMIKPLLVEFDLPTNWGVATSIRANPAGQNSYAVSDPDQAVFLVGRSVREAARRIGSIDFSLLTADQWLFSDLDATAIAAKVLHEYVQLTGVGLANKSALILVPFPGPAPGRWAAETRGSTTVLVFGSDIDRRRALGRLAVVLTHELFHLWVPNALQLKGDYDWFFEGFTLYEALRTAYRLRFIDFSEYLNTIARVYNSYLLSADRDQLSLLQASSRRWTSVGAGVYDKAMLLAFIYDLAIRKQTAGRSSFEGIYRVLFGLDFDKSRDANETLISMLTAAQPLESEIRPYIEGHAPIQLERLVEAYGLRLESNGPVKRLVPQSNLTSEQRRFLNTLARRKT